MRVRTLLVAVTCAAALSGCASAEAENGEEANLNGEMAKVEAIAGSELSTVSLSPEATGHLGITTGAVSVQPVNGRPHLAVPYSAVIYDATGKAWVYTVKQPNVFVRAPVTVVDVAGDNAAVDGGPPVGAKVVTVGVSELFGAETGVGDE
jgi:hypothetical protein